MTANSKAVSPLVPAWSGKTASNIQAKHTTATIFSQAPADLNMAQRHLTLLDKGTDTFVFQTFDDDKKRKAPSLARTIHGTLDQCKGRLLDFSKRGAGVFVTVNHSSNGRRKKEDIDGYRAIFREADEQGLPQLPIEPHFIIESSPGKHHEYLLMDSTTDGATWDAIMATMVNQYGSDPNAADRSRVLRLAGFPHQKDPAQPHLVKIVYESGAQPYSMEEVALHVPPTDRARKQPPSPLSVPANKYGQTALASEIAELTATPEGSRNSQLNKTAFSLGQLVAGGELDQSQAEAALLSAAVSIGLPEAEARRTIESGMVAGAQEPRTKPPAHKADEETDGWPEPSPLITHHQAAPYPLDALPSTIGAAVREVVDFVQCPVALGACSAMAVVSTVGQGLVDVRRANKLEGPTSLYLLAVADSGERKTTVDGFFSKPVQEWEAEQKEAAEPDLKRYEAEKETWEAKKIGILAAIKDASKGGKSTTELEKKVADLEAERPESPKTPRLLHEDSTPEALAFRLAKGWPVGGVLSSEAGTVFGSHAMGKDSAMRSMGLLNKLWEGGRIPVDRRSLESFILQCARLSMGLAVQPETVRAFLDSSKGLARGIGFLARFLVAWPESTQGGRLFKDSPEHWPHLAKFHRRLGALLDHPLPLNDRGELEPEMLELSPEAKTLWKTFHDDVEAELRPGRDMAEVKDVASKAADNAARLAALFHLFEDDPGGAIGPAHMKAAARLAGWHLYEARRFMGEIALPVEVNNAAKLETWLLERCQQKQVAEVSKREIQQEGPSCTREKRTLDAALEELDEAGRVRVVKEGRRKLVKINPALLGGGHGTA